VKQTSGKRSRFVIVVDLDVSFDARISLNVRTQLVVTKTCPCLSRVSLILRVLVALILNLVIGSECSLVTACGSNESNKKVQHHYRLEISRILRTSLTSPGRRESFVEAFEAMPVSVVFGAGEGVAVVVLVTVVDFHLGGAGSQRDGVFQEMLVFFPYVGRDGVEMLDVDVLVRRGPLVVVNSGVVTDDTTVGQARQSQQDLQVESDYRGKLSGGKALTMSSIVLVLTRNHSLY
jgi:hypothetical protein